MFISPQYFQGPRAIAQIEKPTQLANLTLFISQREPDFLKTLMGYPLYKAFIAETATTPISDRMINLLYGAEFTNAVTGMLDYFHGLIPNAQALGITTYLPVDIEIPITGALIGATSYSSVAISGLTVNVDYRVVQRGFGNLGSLAIPLLDINNSKIGWKISTPFVANDVYFIEFITPKSLPIPPVGPIPSLTSPIADYIYYWFIRNDQTFTSGTGQVALKNQNAIPATAKYKSADAWNSMARANKLFREYMRANTTVYPEYPNIYLSYWNNFPYYKRYGRQGCLPEVYDTINTNNF